jgi:hypothetical protein
LQLFKSGGEIMTISFTNLLAYVSDSRKVLKYQKTNKTVDRIPAGYTDQEVLQLLKRLSNYSIEEIDIHVENLYAEVVFEELLKVIKNKKHVTTLRIKQTKNIAVEDEGSSKRQRTSGFTQEMAERLHEGIKDAPHITSTLIDYDVSCNKEIKYKIPSCMSYRNLVGQLKDEENGYCLGRQLPSKKESELFIQQLPRDQEYRDQFFEKLVKARLSICKLSLRMSEADVRLCLQYLCDVKKIVLANLDRGGREQVAQKLLLELVYALVRSDNRVMEIDPILSEDYIIGDYLIRNRLLAKLTYHPAEIDEWPRGSEVEIEILESLKKIKKVDTVSLSAKLPNEVLLKILRVIKADTVKIAEFSEERLNVLYQQLLDSLEKNRSVINLDLSPIELPQELQDRCVRNRLVSSLRNSGNERIHLDAWPVEEDLIKEVVESIKKHTTQVYVDVDALASKEIMRIVNDLFEQNVVFGKLSLQSEYTYEDSYKQKQKGGDVVNFSVIKHLVTKTNKPFEVTNLALLTNGPSLWGLKNKASSFLIALLSSPNICFSELNLKAISKYIDLDQCLKAIKKNLSCEIVSFTCHIPNSVELCQLFSGIIARMKRLISLDLSDSQAADDCIKIIVEQGLKKSFSIASIDLSNNQISEDSAIAIASLIGAVTTIYHVDLSHNLFEKTGLQKLANILVSQSNNVCSLGLLRNDDRMISSGNFNILVDTLHPARSNQRTGLSAIEMKYTKSTANFRWEYYQKEHYDRAVRSRFDRWITDNLKQNRELILHVKEGDGKLPEIKKLISARTSIYFLDENKESLLHIAIRGNKHKKTIRYLIQECYFNLMLENTAGLTALELAYQLHVDEEIIGWLEDPTSLNALPKPGQQKLSFGAAKLKSAPRMDEGAGAAAEVAAPQSAVSTSATVTAVEVADTTRARFFHHIHYGKLLEDVNLEIKNTYGQTSLMVAVIAGQFPCAVEILNKVSEAHTKLQDLAGLNVFHHLCQRPISKESLEFLKTLLKKFSEDLDDVDCAQYTPLYYLCEKRSIDRDQQDILARMLLAFLRHGAAPDHVTQDLYLNKQMTYLHRLIQSHQRIAAELLVAFMNEQREDVMNFVRMSDSESLSAIQIAEQCNCASCAGFLARLALYPDILPGQAQLLKPSGGGVFWSSNLTVFYGAKSLDKQLELNGKSIHVELRKLAENQKKKSQEIGDEMGNVMTKRLTFVMGDRDHQTGGAHHKKSVAIRFDFHDPHLAPQEHEIIQRFKNTPQAFQNTAVSSTEHPESEALNEEGVRALYASKQHAIVFHHSEQRFMSYLEAPSTVSQIIAHLEKEYGGDIKGKKVYSVVLDMYSLYYTCTNCDGTILGQQNPNSIFIQELSRQLQEKGCILPKMGLQLFTRVSTGFQWKRTDVAADGHKPWNIDLRLRPWKFFTETDMRKIDLPADEQASRSRKDLRGWFTAKK